MQNVRIIRFSYGMWDAEVCVYWRADKSSGEGVRNAVVNALNDCTSIGIACQSLSEMGLGSTWTRSSAPCDLHVDPFPILPTSLAHEAATVHSKFESDAESI
jgi:hypothetical protein